MKRFLLAALLIAQGLLSFAQPRTFNGPFEKGTATFQYTLKGKSEKVYNGTFVYREKSATATMVITGTYFNNLKNGTWEYVTMRTGDSRVPAGATEFTTGVFVNGIRDGEWSYTMKDSATGQVLVQSSVTFSNNMPTGAFTYQDVRPAGFPNLSVKGRIDSAGFLDGMWNVSYKMASPDNGMGDADVLYDGFVEYRNGLMAALMHRKVATKEVLKRLNRKRALNEFMTKMDPTTSRAQINGEMYEIALCCDSTGEQLHGVPFDESGMPAHENVEPILQQKPEMAIMAALNFWGLTFGDPFGTEVESPLGRISRGETKTPWRPVRFMMAAY